MIWYLYQSTNCLKSFVNTNKNKIDLIENLLKTFPIKQNLNFQGLGTSEYKTVMRVVEQAILATDLALYFKRKDQFLETANKGEIDWQAEEKKDRKFDWWNYFSLDV